MKNAPVVCFMFGKFKFSLIAGVFALILAFPSLSAQTPVVEPAPAAAGTAPTGAAPSVAPQPGASIALPPPNTATGSGPFRLNIGLEGAGKPGDVGVAIQLVVVMT
ncbi:MAG: hypothetical protein KAX37_09600, partial [Opitutaceae bacterium]|nr:hypothetical protein [Opitutaceae bacterium]